jgi:hypothetical protein
MKIMLLADSSSSSSSVSSSCTQADITSERMPLFVMVIGDENLATLHAFLEI